MKEFYFQWLQPGEWGCDIIEAENYAEAEKIIFEISGKEHIFLIAEVKYMKGED